MKRIFTSLFLTLLLFAAYHLQAQHVEAYNDTVCDTEQYGVIRTNINSFLTSSYVVESIPFAYDADFTNAQDVLQGGTPLSIDDRYSDVIDIGFPFYFFGRVYTQLVVGSNGDIIFEPSIAGEYDSWPISATQLIPDITLPYYNSSTGESYSSIMGAYHDIHAGMRTSISEMKYELRGTAPNRQFIITYHEMPQFRCTSLMTSQQIILYEGTNIIDVQIKHKPVCNTWNNGLATLGLQNADATCYAYPGDNSTPSSTTNRNTSVWEIDSILNPEGWRFSPAGQVSITWYDSNRNVVPGATADSLVVPLDGDLGPYTVEVTFTDCDGMTLTEYDEAQVVVVPTPVLDLGDDQQFFCRDEEIILDGTPQNIADFTTPPDYQWYKDGQPISGATDPTLTVTDPGTYTIEVSSGSCSASDEVVVQHYVNDACIMPEAITPNGDGNNDSFVLDFLDGKVGIDKIEIFNRWGNKVFEKSDGYKDEWHGQNMNGKDLPAAAYFYVIKLKDGTDKTGWVFIIK